MKIYIYIILFLSISLGSCKKFLDVNNNPNAPINENLPLSSKLPAAIINTVNLEAGNLNLMGSFWSGYLGTTNEGIGLYNEFKEYNGLRIRLQREGYKFWEESYINLEQFRLIITQAEQEQQAFYSGVAKIMQGLIFMRLVDLYNNVPFDEALQGTKKFNPAYQNGKEVYDKSVNLISDGIADLKRVSANTTSNSSDIVFNGNVSKWIKFGNTLKLRAFIRQSETSNSNYITTEIAKIQSEGSGFLNANESALVNPGYLNTNGKLNPFWETYYRNVQNVATAAYIDLRPTQYSISQFEINNDPRLSTLFVESSGGYNGVLFGNKNTAVTYSRENTSAFKGPQENSNAPAALFKSLGQPLVLLSDFESLFLQAEAIQRGWLSGSLTNTYSSAVECSLKYMEVPETAKNNYLAATNITFNNASNKLEALILEKWKALYFISGLQSWNDYRRLNLPNIPNSLSSPEANARPLRLMYPETEIGSNNTQVQLQGDNNILTGKIWWDVN